MLLKTLLLIAVSLVSVESWTQDSIFAKSMSDKLYAKVISEQKKTKRRICKKEELILMRLENREKKIYFALRKIDSVKATELILEVTEKYQVLLKRVNTPLAAVVKEKGGDYLPRLDSLSTMLKFLAPVSSKRGEVEEALSSLADLKMLLSQAGDIKTFITERQESLKALTLQFTNLPSGISKSVSRYTKEAYYFKERIAGWREELNNPAKLEKDALKIVSKIPAFQEFMQKNGELARLFGSSGGMSNAEGGGMSGGLQTRTSVQQSLQQQLGSTGANPRQYIQQKLGAGQAELARLKEKMATLKNGSIGDGEMPDFKPNGQKAKKFLKRLEYDWNLQTGSRAANSFPRSNDLGTAVGYKLNDRFSAGIGLAYKFGLGDGLNKIAFTSDGIGIRSYIEYKISSPSRGVRAIFSNIWLTGGYEQNYWSKFKNIPELRNVAWQASGLVGISKKIKYRKKEAKTQILWDFLAAQRGHGDQALKIRLGYNL